MAKFAAMALSAWVLVSFVGAAGAQEDKDIYARQCTKNDEAPLVVVLATTDDGVLYWNGAQITAHLFDSYLNQTVTKGDDTYFFYGDKKRPPRPDIVAAMKKQGIVPRPECRGRHVFFIP
jgi:hypothetical protein